MWVRGHDAIDCTARVHTVALVGDVFREAIFATPIGPAVDNQIPAGRTIFFVRAVNPNRITLAHVHEADTQKPCTEFWLCGDGHPAHRESRRTHQPPSRNPSEHPTSSEN